MSSARTRPIEKFARAVAQCPVQSKEFGRCIAADFNNVKMGKCGNEFLELQKCYTDTLKKK